MTTRLKRRPLLNTCVSVSQAWRISSHHPTLTPSARQSVSGVNSTGFPQTGGPCNLGQPPNPVASSAVICLNLAHPPELALKRRPTEDHHHRLFDCRALSGRGPPPLMRYKHGGARCHAGARFDRQLLYIISCQPPTRNLSLHHHLRINKKKSGEVFSDFLCHYLTDWASR